MIQPVNAIGQMAYITNDLEKSINYWIEMMGAGPFFLLDSNSIDNPRYMGEPTDVDITAALSYNGHMCIELIEQKNDSPSVYQEVMQKRGPGFHHWGYFTDRFDEDVERYIANGYPLKFEGTVKVGSHFAYMDSYDELGGMVELIDFPENVKDLFEGLQAAYENWDGKDPIRST